MALGRQRTRRFPLGAQPTGPDQAGIVSADTVLGNRLARLLPQRLQCLAHHRGLAHLARPRYHLQKAARLLHAGA